MFEVECPSCRAGYKVDERRVPPGGLKMRCPKCGESFQVSSGGGPSEPPVLGAALGLSKPSEKPPEQKAPHKPAPKPPPRPKARATMLGVAPAQQGGGDGFELASLEEEPQDQGTQLPDPGEADLEAGLPSPADQGDEDLEADLPQPSPGGWEQAEPEMDLPVPSSRTPKPQEIDLPMGDEEGDDVGLPDVTGSSEQEAELPNLSGDLPDLEADLPSPGGGDADLPSPGDEFDLPSPGGGADLPDVSGAGLPVEGATNLPSPSGPDLPSPSDGGLPDLSEQLPEPAESLPLPADKEGGSSKLPSYRPDMPGLVGTDAANAEELDFEEAFEEAPEEDEFDLPPPGQSTSGDQGTDVFGSGPTTTPESIEPGAGDPSAFGEVDFGGGAEEEEADEFDAFPTEAPEEDGSGATTEAAGGVGYGDVDFGDDDGAVGLGAEIERPAPGGAPAAATAQVERPDANRAVSVSAPKVPKSGLSTGAKAAIGVAALLTVGGGALAVLPGVGPYGAYVVIDMVKADQYRAALSADRQKVQERLAKDTAADHDAAFAMVDRGIPHAPRFGARKAYAAYVGLMRELRFGSDSNAGARARVLLDELEEESPAEVDFLVLARDARAVAGGKPDEVVAAGKQKLQKSPEYAALVGEAALRGRKPELARQAFSSLKRETPQSTFGQARAFLLEKDMLKAAELAEKTLERSPEHPGASLLLAELHLRDAQKDQELLETLQPFAEGKGGVSEGERVKALVLLGDLHMARSRINRAEEAYQKALKLESGNADAQRGLADALFAGGRFSEAQTRYEAALKADPDSLSAALGLVRSKLRLEELERATALLDELETKHPESTAVHYWIGRTHEQLGEREKSTKAYRKAIELDQGGDELVKSYIALTRLLGQSGKLGEAAEIIQDAQEKFPEDPLVFQALAELAESRGSYEKAVDHYDKALELDPNNIGLRFSKGVALRKARRFEEAAAEFDAVDQQSKDYPGLALERGNLFEASGKTEQALKAYEEALAKAPEDPDLKLRVGCGKANAGQPGPALELLQQVHEERPNSAEVNFCMGLAHLEDGKLPTARRFIQRAVNFDSSRANYHLYMGWVALDMNDYAVAHQSLEKALEIDQTLADAYWKQGELLVKQGAIETAEKVLRKALELSPSRFEAHAQLALALSQMGKEQEAMTEWKRATSEEGAKAYWHYRYGKLLFDNRQVEPAKKQLKLAIEKIQDEEPAPPWRWEAHRVLALAIGRKKAALEHWQAFLKHGPTTSAYRPEAQREMDAILKKLGY